MMALMSDGKVYSCSRNDSGVLGNRNKHYEIIKPKINEYSTNKAIIDMSCAAYHSMVLTQNIEIYVWGIMILNK
jgi:alpha-tubulin suppressor-like RCC1 family protein